MTQNNLTWKIAEKIRSEGAITFEKFMQMALYDPEFGYYTSGRSRIGRRGDFYTSSCLHPVFGKMIGKQLEEMWEIMERPRDFAVLEMGAGPAYLCRDILDSLKDCDIISSLTYGIIEPIPGMRKTQHGVLRNFDGVVEWFSSLEEIGGVRGCLLSNELLDAFPVHLVQREDTWEEVYVSVEQGRFAESLGPVSDRDVAEYLDRLTFEPQRGYRTEVNLRIRDWLRSVANSLVEGFVLTIDYGYTARDYYSEDRNRGTLMCYRRHELVEDPLANVGDEDITAHVNFSAVKKWGEDAGFGTVGFCGQGAYLTSLGIDEEIQRLASESRDFLFELARIKKLILPQGMGESHMVMVQYRGEKEPVLKGFTLRNRMKYL